MTIERRKLLGFGIAALGSSLMGGACRADTPPAANTKSFSSIEALLDESMATTAKPVAAERSLSFLNLHTGESLKATYFEGGAYVPDALSAVNKVVRDFRTGDVYPMNTGLLDTLVSLQSRLGVQEPIQVICGYRSPKTNAALAARSGQVAKHSLHMEGEAMDIRLPGVDLDRLHRAALSLGRGGVGYYPVSNFVHIDVGKVRTWSGT